MAGEYRTPEVLATLPPEIADAICNGVRIALTNQSMQGVKTLPEIAEVMANAFQKIG